MRKEGNWKKRNPRFLGRTIGHQYLAVAAEPGRDGKPSNWGKLKPNSITQSGLEGIASRHGYRVEKLGKSLFNLREDPGERRNVMEHYPGEVSRLEALAAPLRAELGDALEGVKGSGIRPAGQAAAERPGSDGRVR